MGKWSKIVADSISTTCSVSYMNQYLVVCLGSLQRPANCIHTAKVGQFKNIRNPPTQKNPEYIGGDN